MVPQITNQRRILSFPLPPAPRRAMQNVAKVLGEHGVEHLLTPKRASYTNTSACIYARTLGHQALENLICPISKSVKSEFS